MKKVGAALPLLIFSAPVYAHDFTVVFVAMGAALLSLFISMIIIGEGNRRFGLLIIIIAWVAIIITNDIGVLVIGSVVLVVLQPIFAMLFKKYKRAKSTL